MSFRDEVKKVARFDFTLFHRHPRLMLACFGVMFVPALYSAIYLSSAWDPYGRVDQLPVIVVNLDRGADIRGRHVSLGESMSNRLVEKHTFSIRTVDDESVARDAVISGDAAFALIIPADTTEIAMRASEDSPAPVRILFSEGNNFVTGTVARRFADELTRNANEGLNTERWSAVLTTVDGSRASLAKLKDGVTKLQAGAHRLESGLQQASDGAGKIAAGAHRASVGVVQLRDGASQVADATQRLTNGVSKLGGGLRQLDAAMPDEAKLKTLRDGARTVADAQAQLTSGLSRLSDGTSKARAGATQLKDGTAGIPIVGGRISEGAGKLETGLTQLEAGAQKAEQGSSALAAGGSKVADGVEALTGGVTKISGAVSQMTEKLPDDATLNRLADGSARIASGTDTLSNGLGALSIGTQKLDDGLVKLSDGATQLANGLDTLSDALPTSVDGLQGDARGLARSVTPSLEPLTTVGAYGNSMVPYFLGLSLWIGVVMLGFIFQLRWFPSRLRAVNGSALLLGRLAIPVSVVVGQATLLTLTLKFIVGATVPSLAILWLVAVTTAIVFMCVLLMLIGLFGDIGKVIALLFLVFQMGASGGVFPLPMSNAFFQAVHPFLPFSWVLKAARAALFNAYGGAWLPALAVLASFGVGAFVITSIAARWKFVPRHRFVPLMDV